MMSVVVGRFLSHNHLGLWLHHAQLHLIVVVTLDLAQVDQAGLDAKDEIVERLGAGHQVERCRQRSSLVKVGEPQLGPGKLPLHVGVLLQGKGERTPVISTGVAN